MYNIGETELYLQKVGVLSIGVNFAISSGFNLAISFANSCNLTAAIPGISWGTRPIATEFANSFAPLHTYEYTKKQVSATSTIE